MKKLNYLLVVLFAVGLLTTSCEKDDILPETPEVPTGITTDQLTGNWVFDFIIIDGDTITDLELLRNNGVGWDWISITNVTTDSTLVIVEEDTDIETPCTYNLSENIITIDSEVNDNFLVFEIKDVETFDETTLKLKLIASEVVLSSLIGSEYVFTRLGEI